MDLLLIRHGQTTWNAERRLQGQRDSPLSDYGVRQAEALAERLAPVRLTAIYTSDLERAYRTAEAIDRRHGLGLRARADLREVHLGRWEGRTVADLERDEAEADSLTLWRENAALHRPPGAERLEDLQARAVAALGEIAAAHGDGTIAVVTHGGVVKAAVGWALGLPLDRQRRFGVDNGSITALRWEKRGSLLLRLNDTCHDPRP